MNKACSWWSSFEAKHWNQVGVPLIQYFNCTVRAKCSRSSKVGKALLDRWTRKNVWQEGSTSTESVPIHSYPLTRCLTTSRNFSKGTTNQMQINVYVCTREVTASFLRAKEWKQLKYPVIGEYMNKRGVNSWKWEGYGLGETKGIDNSDGGSDLMGGCTWRNLPSCILLYITLWK